MARKKKDAKGSSGPKQTWLVTFGDLVTLLLTFFVLLLSMSSMDRSILTRVSVFTRDLGFLTYRGAGKVSPEVELVVELMERPQDLLMQRDRIKDLLFPDEVLPEKIDRATLEENLEILKRPEGVALVLSDKLLFESGSAELTQGAREILAQVLPVLDMLAAPVNVAGYSDAVGGASESNYILAGRRARSVMTYFLSRGMPPELFSVSAYGPHLPLASNETPEGRARNRRVEILVRTQPLLGGYA
ncbi:OmpA/MotB family protein [Desulfohalovibrio reitneri]|uniref:OmpA/MotB family protein n=1 Tax=Desulfohalovibrio reitneri TaxID=1307759 RepID=UPI0004A71E92|nr:OmpA family protein [Desulfohalovibrio reitneri]